MRKLAAALAPLLLAHFILQCRTPDKKPDPPPAPVRPAFDLAAANAELAAVPITGFKKYKQHLNTPKFERQAGQTIKVMARLLEQMPQSYKIEITGHAREYRKMNDEYVKTLSGMRAQVVLHYLVRNGIPEDRLLVRSAAEAAEETPAGEVTFRITTQDAQ